MLEKSCLEGGEHKFEPVFEHIEAGADTLIKPLLKQGCDAREVLDMSRARQVLVHHICPQCGTIIDRGGGKETP